VSKALCSKGSYVRKLDCAYCGVRKSSKKGDHIPPQSLYPKPRKPNLQLHAVPSCEECNNPASRDDEIFKVIISVDTAEERLETTGLQDSLTRTLSHNDRLAKELFEKAKKVYLDRGKGIAEPLMKVKMEFEAYRNVVQRMIRGLYWKETSKPMHKNTVIHVEPANSQNKELLEALCTVLKSVDPVLLNDDTFLYKVYLSEDGSSIWEMKFFNKHTVFAYAEPHEHNKGVQSDLRPLSPLV
jgi:5-methylcytosine-specific restriction endonuclease McrA